MRSTMIDIKNINIERIEYNTAIKPFDDPKSRDRILSLLSTRRNERLSFIIDADVSVANAIRRVIVGELKIKVTDKCVLCFLRLRFEEI